MLFRIAAVLFLSSLVACGTSDDDATASGGDSCSVGQFSATKALTGEDALPFSVDIPDAFAGNLSGDDSSAVTLEYRNVNPNGSAGVFSTSVIVLKMAQSDTSLLDTLASSSAYEDTTIAYDGGTIRTVINDQDDRTQIITFIDVGGMFYNVTFLSKAPKDCDVERAAIVDLIKTTLASNPNTTFP